MSRPHPQLSTASHPHSEVKPGRAWIVQPWGTGLEVHVLRSFFFFLLFFFLFFFFFLFVTKSTDYVIASTRSTFANSPVSFHEPCLRTGAPPGSSRQEFQKEKHSSRTEATAKTLVLKKTTGIRNTGPMELRKSPPRNRQQTPHQTTNYDKTNN